MFSPRIQVTQADKHMTGHHLWGLYSTTWTCTIRRGYEFYLYLIVNLKRPRAQIKNYHCTFINALQILLVNDDNFNQHLGESRTRKSERLHVLCRNTQHTCEHFLSFTCQTTVR